MKRINVTMESTTKRYKFEYVSAIDPISLAESEAPERFRQRALLVKTMQDGETFEQVVFGYDMPDDEEDVKIMFGDPSAWDSTEAVLDSVERPRRLLVERYDWTTRGGRTELYDLVESRSGWDDASRILETGDEVPDWLIDYVLYEDLTGDEFAEQIGRDMADPEHKDSKIIVTLYNHLDDDNYAHDHDGEYIDQVEYWLSDIAKFVYDRMDDDDKAVAKAAQINELDDWDDGLNLEFCILAGMEDEYQLVQNDSADVFEDVLRRAAGKLGVKLRGL